MSKQQLIKYCITNADRKWKTASTLLAAKRFADCLFFCHLALEFTLKGKVVAATGRTYPLTHDLVDLGHKAGLEFTRGQLRDLSMINTFNIAGRYDDYKSTFYKKATPAFTKKHFDITKNLLLWLKKK